MMQVHLTFDIEVWCNGWSDLDSRFAASFERYCFGHSAQGDYALPKTLEILARHGLTGVFFVEPLFSARFGSEHLRTMTDLILAAGQDVQLHLHAEWTDEIRPPLIDDVSRKRQHLTLYSEGEQAALIGHARDLLQAATGRPVTAFRAGSFAANRDTYRALARNGIRVDSSLNAMADHAGGSIADIGAHTARREIEGVEVYPVTVFRDGFGRARPAQVGASGFGELRLAIDAAAAAGCPHFVIVSHNFEMLKPGRSEPDWVVVRRFEQLCAWLEAQRGRLQVAPLPLPGLLPLGASVGVARLGSAAQEHRPSVPWWSTTRRHVEQLRRRLG